jgi:hypothetical protein
VAEGVKKSDPELFDKVKAGAVPLRGAVKEVERKEGRPAKRTKARAAPEPTTTEPESPLQPQAASEPPQVHADDVEPTNAPDGDVEPAGRIDLPGFEAIEHADQVQQRAQFARLCSSLVALPLPTQFIARHDGKLDPEHLEPARAAHQWLTAVVSNLEPEPQAAVTWTLDGFLHKRVQVSDLMERHGVEIAELLANRISPGPDIAIVRAALAHLGELDRRFGVLEYGAGREG